MIETYTVACLKSLETSTRTTVTERTRGSATSKRIAVATTSRIASAIRKLRCVGIDVHLNLVLLESEDEEPGTR